jgi:phosphatidylglycerophosphate synthase/putative flippase GtrA
METLKNLMIGHLTSEGRVWTAIGPAVIFASYFIVGMAVYLIRCAVKGTYRDAELEKRGSTVLANMWFRMYFAWIMQPLWRLVIRTGVPATAITTLSVLLATAAGVSCSVGRFALGGWLYILAGICDFLDGRVARARNSATKSGAALDSILDRYSDAVVLVGLSWYYRDSWVLLAVQAALVGSSLVPYIRARGEAAGVSIKEVGVMQRAERILYLGVAVAMSPVLEVILAPQEVHPLHRLAVVGVVLLAVSTQVTALQRLIYLLGVLDDSWGLGWLRRGGGALARNIVAAGVATSVDFAVVTALVSGGVCTAPVATAAGAAVGAIVNFTVNRVWTFKSRDAHLPQISRYGFVSLTSALLNAGGVAVLLLLPGIDYRLAWLLVRGAVFFAWNFPLHRDYVFAAQTQPA